MNYSIKNEQLKVIITNKGAELQSIKSIKTGREFLWQGDNKIWGKRSPLLFPVIGRIIDDKLKIDDKEYAMKKHGIAQDYNFEVDSTNEDEITFVLRSCEEMKINYPYDFELFVNYKLQLNNLKITYRVKNLDRAKMYFSIGAHPGFNCGMGDVLEFECNETLETYLMNDDAYLYDKILCLNNQKQIVVQNDTFQNDALMFQNMKSRHIILKGKGKDYKVKVYFNEAPYLGLWAKPCAPYVCIEPWFGINDFVDANYQFADKPGVIGLGVGKEFDYEIGIELDG